MTARDVAVIACFVGFLYPVTVSEVSLNYSFVLLPLAVVLRRGTVKKPPEWVLLCLVLFSMVFIAASLYQIEFTQHALRRLVSFAIFMSVFSYMLVAVDAAMIRAFKSAVVIIALLFSLGAAYVFVAGGGAAIGFDAKNLVGSQRFGFIYVLAFWIVLIAPTENLILSVGKYVGVLVLISGLLLTFTRSSIVALLTSVILFVTYKHLEFAKRPRLTVVLRTGTSVVGLASVLVAVNKLFPTTVGFFDVRLVRLLLEPGALATNLSDPATSEGTRMMLAETILRFALRNPLTGSGYLGIWVVSDVSGSAHNQYTDVIFRTGLLGFGAYCYLLWRLVLYLANRDRALLWGFIGVLVYGMFHETFKESQGAFVLAFLLGMMAHGMRNRDRPKREPLRPARAVVR